MKLTANLLARTLIELVKISDSKQGDLALVNFSKFLINNGWSSESKIKKIFSAYKLMQSVSGEKQMITVTSARSLSEVENKSVVNTLKNIYGHSIEIDNQINEDLLGGLVLEGYDWRYSADVKSNLKRLRANLVNS